MILTYENARGESLVFCDEAAWLDKTPYYLTHMDGAHGLKSELTTVALYPQDGETYIGARVDARDITLRGIIRKEPLAHSIASNRIHMLHTFRPKEIGSLTLSRGAFKRRIPCVVERAPYCPSERGDRFTIDLFCPQPYWEDATGDSSVMMNGWIGLFEFPLEIEDGVGFEFGTRVSSIVVDVSNPGDVDTGFLITFLARGTVVNPVIQNVVTGKKMQLMLTMRAGDVARISTVRFDRWLTVMRADDTPENAMQFVAPDFEFLQLTPGANHLRATADSGGELLDSSLIFKPLFLGV